MARLSIDIDILRADPRFKAYIRRGFNGDERMAIGALIDFWRTAQEFYKDGGKPIPRASYDLGDYGPLLDVGLAREVDGGVEADGSKENFDWLRQRVDAGKVKKNKPKPPSPFKPGRRKKRSEQDGPALFDTLDVIETGPTAPTPTDANWPWDKIPLSETTETETQPTEIPLADTEPALPIPIPISSAITKTKTNPPNTPRRGRSSRQTRNDLVEQVVTKMIGAARSHFSDEVAARKAMGPTVISLIPPEFARWEHFCALLSKADNASKGTTFRSQLKRTVGALMETQSTGPPESPAPVVHINQEEKDTYG